MAFHPSASTGSTTAVSPATSLSSPCPQSFIDDYDVHLAHGPTFDTANTQLTGYVHVLDAPAGTPVTIDIPEAAARTTVTTDAEGNAPFSVKAAKLVLWSPDSPKLYKVHLAAGQDQLTDDIGFRDIRVDGTRILLNGKAIFLQGANMHAEAPVRGGRAYSQEDADRIFGYLQRSTCQLRSPRPLSPRRANGAHRRPRWHPHLV